MPDTDPLDAVYGSFQPFTPLQACEILRGFGGRWWIGGGWSIEAFTKIARPHDDLDICLDRACVGDLVAHLEGSLQVWAAGSGNLRPLLDATEPPPDWSGQVWVRESYGRPWLIDFLLSPLLGDSWVFKRNPFITLPLEAATHIAADGLRYERPEVTLLYKAKHNRPKDRADFDVTVPLLDDAARAWLFDSIAETHPHHPWLAALWRPSRRSG